MKSTMKLGKIGILDLLYDVPMLGVLFLAGVVAQVRIVQQPNIVFDFTEELANADSILRLGYNVRWNYQRYFTTVVGIVVGMLVILLQFCVTMYRNGSIPMIVLALVNLQAYCQVFAPLIMTVMIIDSGCRRTSTSVRILKGADSPRMTSEYIRWTLDEIARLNFQIVSTSRRAMRFSMVNLIACFYLSLYPLVLGIVSMKKSSTAGGKDLIMNGMYSTSSFVVAANIYQWFFDEQKKLAITLNDLELRHVDSSVDTVRRIFLLQLMHHRVDTPGSFPINRRLILKCISVLCAVTMFLFRLYPELIH